MLSKMPKDTQPVRRGSGVGTPVQLPSDPCSVHPASPAESRSKAKADTMGEVGGPLSIPELEMKILPSYCPPRGPPQKHSACGKENWGRLGGDNVLPLIVPLSPVFGGLQGHLRNERG